MVTERDVVPRPWVQDSASLSEAVGGDGLDALLGSRRWEELTVDTRGSVCFFSSVGHSWDTCPQHRANPHNNHQQSRVSESPTGGAV